jgi:CheY-like chemotaxis protein
MGKIMSAIDITYLVGRRARPPGGGRAIDLADQSLRARLAGRRVLLVEDEFLIADEISLAFARLGVGIVGPARTLEQALQLLANSGHLDGAVLDVNMRGKMVFPLADALQQSNVPFIFATGYDPKVIPERYRDVPRCEKPLDMLKVVETLFPNKKTLPPSTSSAP